jgi:hypothetical protein
LAVVLLAALARLGAVAITVALHDRAWCGPLPSDSADTVRNKIKEFANCNNRNTSEREHEQSSEKRFAGASTDPI